MSYKKKKLQPRILKFFNGLILGLVLLFQSSEGRSKTLVIFSYSTNKNFSFCKDFQMVYSLVMEEAWNDSNRPKPDLNIMKVNYVEKCWSFNQQQKNALLELPVSVKTLCNDDFLHFSLNYWIIIAGACTSSRVARSSPAFSAAWEYWWALFVFSIIIQIKVQHECVPYNG